MPQNCQPNAAVRAHDARNGCNPKIRRFPVMIRAKWLLAAIAIPLSISTAFAAINPDKLPQVQCSDMKFGAAFLAKYPQAPAACQQGVIYNGHRYAKFVAQVYISSPQFMTVQLLNAAGATVTTFSFKPAPGQGVHVNGQL